MRVRAHHLFAILTLLGVDARASVVCPLRVDSTTRRAIAAAPSVREAALRVVQTPDAAAWNDLAVALAAVDRRPEAATAARHALESAGTDALLLEVVQFNLELFTNGETVAAATSTDALVKISRLWLMCERAIDNGDLTAAQEALSHAEQVAPQPADSPTIHSFLRARIAEAGGEFDVAKERFAALVKRDPAFVPAHFALADLHAQLDEHERAVVAWEDTELAAGPSRICPPVRRERIYFNHANSLIALGRHRDAVAQLRTAISLVASRHESLVAARNSVAPNAPSQLRTLLVAAADPTYAVYPEASNNLGSALLADPIPANLLAAERAFRAALASPRYPTPWIARTNLGRVALLNHQPATAIAHFGTALAAQPFYEDAINELRALSLHEADAIAADATLTLMSGLLAWPGKYAAARYDGWLAAVQPRMAKIHGPAAAHALAGVELVRGDRRAAEAIYARALARPSISKFATYYELVEPTIASAYGRLALLNGTKSAEEIRRLIANVEMPDARSVWELAQARDFAQLQALVSPDDETAATYRRRAEQFASAMLSGGPLDSALPEVDLSGLRGRRPILLSMNPDPDPRLIASRMNNLSVDGASSADVFALSSQVDLTSITLRSDATSDIRAELATGDAMFRKTSDKWLATVDVRGGGAIGGGENVDRSNAKKRAHLELGAPVIEELYLFGQLDYDSDERRVPAGNLDGRIQRDYYGKAALSLKRHSLAAVVNRTRSDETAFNAAPGTRPSALQNELQRRTHYAGRYAIAFTDDLLQSFELLGADSESSELPNAQAPLDALLDSEGFRAGNPGSYTGELRGRTAKAKTSWYSGSLQLAGGVEGNLSTHVAEETVGNRNVSVIARPNVSASETDIARLWRTGRASAERRDLAAFAAVEGRHRQFNYSAGVRFEQHDGTTLAATAAANPISSELVPAASSRESSLPGQRHVLPRVGISFDPRQNGRYVFSAGYGEYARPYDSPELFWTSAARTGWLDTAFIDRNRNGTVDPQEELRFLAPHGIRRGSGSSPSSVDPDLRTELRRDARAGFAFNGRSLSLAATYVHQRTTNVIDAIPFIAGTAIRPARAEDYERGIVLTGGALLTNTDREIVSDSISVDLRIARKYGAALFAGAPRWRIGPRFRGFDDPADLAATATSPAFNNTDTSGQPHGRLWGTDERSSVIAQSRWGLNVWTQQRISRWNLDVTANAHAQEGAPRFLYERVLGRDGVIRDLARTDESAPPRYPNRYNLDLRFDRDLADWGGMHLKGVLQATNVLGSTARLREIQQLRSPRALAVEQTVEARAVVAGLRIEWQ